MNRNILLIILAFLVVAIIAVAILSKRIEEEQLMMEQETLMPADSFYEENGLEEANMEDETMEEQSGGSYLEYSEATTISEINKGQTVVLFFKANWCPTCLDASANFTTRTEEIPANVSLLEVDYDSAIDLRSRYGVITQHTFVQLDENQELVNTWISGDISALKSNLK